MTELHGAERKPGEQTVPMKVTGETAVVNETATPTQEKRTGFYISRRKAVIAAAGGSALVLAAGGALAFGLLRGTSGEAKANGDAPDPAKNDKATSVTPAPTESESPESSAPSGSATPETTTTPETTGNSLAIPAGLSPKEYGDAMTDRLSQWMMMGATDDLFDKWVMAGSESETKALLQKTAEDNAKIMTDALFIPGWQDVPSLVELRDKELQINRADLDSWLHTYKSIRPEDTEPWQNSVSLSAAKLVSDDEGVRTIQIVGVQHNNADKNRIGSQYDPSQIKDNGRIFEFSFDTGTVDGKELLSSYANLTPQ